MPENESFESLSQHLQDANSAIVTLATGQPPTLDLRRLTLSQGLANEFLTVVGQVRTLVHGRHLVPFDVGYQPDPHELAFLAATADPHLAAVAELFNEPLALPTLAAGDADQIHTKFYAITASLNQSRATIFRHTPSSFFVNRSKIVAVLTNETYNQLQQPALMFDESFDAIYWDGYYFVKEPHQFRRIFNYFNELRQSSKAVFDSFAGRIPIDNATDLEAALGSNTLMQSKLTKASGKAYLTTLTMPQVKAIIDKFGLDIPVVTRVDGSEALTWKPSREARWHLLKLMDDDYLESALTTLKYEVNSKVSR